MKQILTAAIVIAIMVLFVAPSQSLAAGDTLVVYAKGATLDKVIRGDTTSTGAKAHHVYRLVSTDTTYIIDGTITTNSSITILGVPNPTTGRPPCIQPDVLGDGSIPGTMFTLTGNNTTGTFKSVYLLGLAVNNSPEFVTGIAIQISADNVRLAVDNCILEEWMGFAIGYNGNNDKFFITNSKFRNMVHPNQWYVGEVLRNEYPGSVPTDSIVFRGNTMFCVNGYAAAPVTKFYVSYFEFTHNNVIYTFKNPFFIFNVTKAKINNNVFYAAWAGAINKTEYPWWDQLWSPEVGSLIDMDRLDSAKAAVVSPSDVGKSAAVLDSLAELKRTVEVKNNVYFWPTTLTQYWKSWNDTSHVDSIYTPTWMNARTTGMFNDKTRWPGFVQSGNLNVDPGYGTSIPNVLTQTSNGFLAWFKLCRTGLLTNTYWNYQKTQVGSAANWVPAWPLPEATDMKYTNASLKTGATDGLPIGDPNWFGIATAVEKTSGVVPQDFTLSEAYPNPFNPSTNIQYTLNTSGMTNLKVYNILGQLVRTAVNDAYQQAGTYKVNIDMSNLPSGMYVYILEQGANRLAHKMMLLK